MHGTFVGAVVIRTVDQHRIVVSLDATDEAEARDGFVDRIFTLQTEVPVAPVVAGDFGRATLALSNGNLFVDPADGAGLRLQVTGFDLADRQSLSFGDRLALGEVDQETPRRLIVGVGLAQQVVPPEARFALSRARALDEYVPVEGSACAASQPFGALGGEDQRQNCTDGYCPAGGEGSTGCSMGDCTVNCGAGTYACCDGSTCKCCGS